MARIRASEAIDVRSLGRALIVAACLAGGGGRAIAQTGCDGTAMASFLMKAQTLAPDSESAGRSLLACGGVEYREATLYWLGFYLHKTQQDGKFPDLLKSWPQSNQNEKGLARYRAWAGEPLSLKSKIQSGASGFADDASLLLTLARASVRAGYYKDGLQSYEVLFRQLENQDAAEAERLFAYIWAGDPKGARLQLAALRRYELSPYLSQAMERAEALLGPDRSLNSPLIGVQGPWLRVSAEQAQDTRGYSLRGLKADYSGLIDMGIHAFEFHHPLADDGQNQAHFSLGKIFDTGSLRWHAGIGFFSGGDQHVTAIAQSEWYPSAALAFGLGIKREPLALVERPLLGDRQGLMRDTAEASFGYRQRLILKAAMQQDDDVQRFEAYSGEARLGSLLSSEWDEGFGFFIPFSYKNRPLPSRDFTSYPRELRAGLGLRLALGDGASYRVGTEALIETIRRSYYGETNSFSQLLGGRVQVDARYYATASLYFFGATSMSLTERDPYERSNERSTAVSVGVALRDIDSK